MDKCLLAKVLNANKALFLADNYSLSHVFSALKRTGLLYPVITTFLTPLPAPLLAVLIRLQKQNSFWLYGTLALG